MTGVALVGQDAGEGGFIPRAVDVEGQTALKVAQIFGQAAPVHAADAVDRFDALGRRKACDALRRVDPALIQKSSGDGGDFLRRNAPIRLPGGDLLIGGAGIAPLGELQVDDCGQRVKVRLRNRFQIHFEDVLHGVMIGESRIAHIADQCAKGFDHRAQIRAGMARDVLDARLYHVGRRFHFGKGSSAWAACGCSWRSWAYRRSWPQHTG